MNESLKKNILKKRSKLSEKEVQDRSRKVVDKLLCNKLIEYADTVFVYLSYKREVDTFRLIEKLLKKKIKVAVPWTFVKLKQIIPVSISLEDLKNNLVLGPYGILQPSKKLFLENNISPKSLNLSICPGSVFARDGSRCGYGGGYYDRFLAREDCQEITKIALAYNFQLFDKIVQKEHDIKMDFIFTENEVINCRFRTV